MLYFTNDYNCGCHPRILAALAAQNDTPMDGYGLDPVCASAEAKILAAAGCPDGSVTFLNGGTQTNAIVIDAYLHSYEGVVAATTAHIAVHEAGAIEGTGHKILTIPSHEGKMAAAELRQYLQDFYADGNCEHMVQPGMVYLSWPTEYGTLYSKAELTAIAAVCREYKLPLFCDGARLGYGLASPESDLTLSDLASLCDVFYIGGTKVGALLGEAVVFPKKAPAHFMTHVKRRGGLLAKGYVLGAQFDTLFTDGLYLSISRHAVELAMKIRTALQAKGYPLAVNSPTNQQFPIVPNSLLPELQKKVAYSFWEKKDEGHTVIRFATSWSTRAEDVDALLAILPDLK
jgi:threonine aldolase